MKLSDIADNAGSRKKRMRVGRGIGSGKGKTAGRGGKGQKARTGNMHFNGFEGGQMPLQRRMPKVGFRSSLKALRAEVRLHELALVTAPIIDLAALKAAQLVPVSAERVKVMLSGELKKAVHLKGIGATKGARAAIEAAGGKVED
jgi:large subunit ribosomal protein L15